MGPEELTPRTTWTRRRLLIGGVGSVIAAAFGVGELVEHGVLPGKVPLDRLLGACSVSGPDLTFAAPGRSIEGSFYSRARGLRVGYTIAYPPGHGPGSKLPLVLSLHGNGGNHTSGLGGITLVKALAARQAGRPLPPMAVVAVDGGNLYWNPHPGDDPMAMLVDEVIPRCRHLGLGRSPGAIGVVGISMGGYGALLLAERHPQLISAVAAISPAIWTTYPQARAVNRGAFASAADFARDDLITHISALSRTPVRVASGSDDPFHPGVVAFVRRLPPPAIVELTAGCHDNAFFAGGMTRCPRPFRLSAGECSRLERRDRDRVPRVGRPVRLELPAQDQAFGVRPGQPDAPAPDDARKPHGDRRSGSQIAHVAAVFGHEKRDVAAGSELDRRRRARRDVHAAALVVGERKRSRPGAYDDRRIADQ